MCVAETACPAADLFDLGGGEVDEGGAVEFYDAVEDDALDAPVSTD